MKKRSLTEKVVEPLMLIAGFACVAGAFFFWHKANKSTAGLDQSNNNAIIRLVQNGRTFCSGVVVSDEYIITAAHCIRGAPANEPIIEIRTNNNKPSGIMASVLSYNERGDTAILKGNFGMLPTMEVEDDPSEIHRSMLSDSIITCGYPWGSGRLTCTKMSRIRRAFFSYAGIGYLYPGQSGGPTIDLDTGKVLAVNQAVSETEIIVNPLAEVFKDLLNEARIKSIAGLQGAE